MWYYSPAVVSNRETPGNTAEYFTVADPSLIKRLSGWIMAAAVLAAVGCGGPLPPPDPHNLAGAKDSLSRGNHWYGLGCYVEAERYYAEGLDFARMSDDVLLIVRAQNSLGAAALARGEVNLAAAHLELALSNCQAQPDEPELDKILANLGSLAFKLGRLDDAGDFWSRALEVAENRGQNPAPYLCDLARLQLACNNQTEFMDLAARALAATENDADRYVRADALNLAGQAALLQDRLPEAESLYRQALELDRKTENTTGLAQDTESLGLLMTRLERHREAAGFLDRAFFLWLAVGDDQKAGRVLAGLQQLSREHGFPKKLSVYQEAQRHPDAYRLTKQCP